jgi:uncharacterized protein (TIGR03066 family)
VSVPLVPAFAESEFSMSRVIGLVLLLLTSSAPARADDLKPEDLLGKWELTEEAAKLPKGTVFDFQPGGKLVVTTTVGGEKKTLGCKYELKPKEKRLAFTIGEKTDTTAVLTLNDQELVCQDNDGTTPKFRRVK